MENNTANTKKDFVYDPFKRYFDAFVEWHDHANQWDVSEVWDASQPAQDADHGREEPPARGTDD